MSCPPFGRQVGMYIMYTLLYNNNVIPMYTLLYNNAYNANIIVSVVEKRYVGDK